jgi:acyl carrier protein/NAD(P)-dependent dehydrogenase (short-subunit alcohol dehydrogenase family)
LVFNKLLANLWEQGIDINWALYNQGPDGGGVGGRTSSQSAPVQRVPLPSYSFEKTSHWINPTASIYVTPEEQLAPVYKVAWQPLQDIPASISETKVSINEPLTIKLGFDEIAIDDALVSAVKSPHGIVLVMQYPPEPTKNDEIDMGWNFLRFVQDLTSQTASGRVTMICVASPLGALAVGASRSVVQEYPKLEIMRLFLPASDLDQLQTTSSLGSNMSLVLDCCKGQTDVLLPDGLVTGGRILGQILEPMILDNPKPTLRPARPTFAIDEDDRGGVYLITGGTGALGQALIKRLISQHHVPEKRIILLSRSRKEKENTPFPKIRTIFVDCSDPLQLKSNTEIQSIDNVSGIFHLAGMLDDAIVANQSLKRLSKVVAPKVAIATLLELAEKQEWNPRFVLTYSSTTSLLGYAGQSNYGAANAILDHMANDWGSQDDESTYPTIAVNWGSWGEVGMAKEGTKAYDTSIRQGDLPMSTSAALGALEALFDRLFELGDIRGQYAITGMNWPASPWRTHPILNSVISKGADQRHQQQRQSKHSPSSTNASPALSSSANAQQSVEELLSNHLSRWDPEETLVALGLDSLDMLQLVRDVSNTFAIDVGLQDVMRASQTLSQFIERVVKEILEAA